LFIGFNAADQDTVVQWTERHIVLLQDKQIVRGSSTPDRADRSGGARPQKGHHAQVELILRILSFKRRYEIFLQDRRISLER
ncbi:hypothetical protein, partial [Klebsiella variicola]|uniref:hypothetical protein n=1 Tax=Klebsiella variicola TaxID=244366 RepID=UPI0027308A6F